jgi:hypothetical protein
VEGVGPGSVLAGRYTVGALVRQSAGAQRWTAREPVLGRSVSLLILPSGDSRAAAVLDAARMAAGLDIPGCVRILDIGQEGPAAWVVEEALADAKSVVDLVRNGGLPGDEVRRIVGEAATSLDAAAARGLHHLRITPEEVFRTPEGDIKVRGLATEAALHGAEEDSVSADRTDAVCLVALTYAALTGLWPLRDLPSALPPAPRLVRGVPAPSEIAAGVPRDLDTLCRLTFGGTGGPTSPGDYARQIAPWSSRQIFGRPTLPEAAAARRWRSRHLRSRPWRRRLRPRQPWRRRLPWGRTLLPPRWRSRRLLPSRRWRPRSRFRLLQRWVQQPRPRRPRPSRRRLHRLRLQLRPWGAQPPRSRGPPPRRERAPAPGHALQRPRREVPLGSVPYLARTSPGWMPTPRHLWSRPIR